MAVEADLEFLKKMNAEAKRLAKRLDSLDHWAKPFASDVHLFKPGVRRVFIGINGKGNRYSLEYDQKQQNTQRIWSGHRPFHNAYLDECWGDQPGGPHPRGESELQIAVKRVFHAMYGNSWKRKLRNTPCFNLVPVSSNGTDDPKLLKIWEDGREWGINLIKYLRPRNIILYCNNQSPNSISVWAALAKEFHLDTPSRMKLDKSPFSIYVTSIRKGNLEGVSVFGMPHLSRVKNLSPLLNKLKEIGELSPFP